ncbi:DNA polymerase III subunit delta [Dermabacteraceae bacterium P13103]
MADVEWHSVPLKPLILLQGSEVVLSQRAVARLKKLALAAHPDTTITTLNAPTCRGGELMQALSPSLFSEPQLIIVEEAQQASEPLLKEIAALSTTEPDTDTHVVIVHKGGNRGKTVFDAVKKKALKVACDPIKKPAEKQTFASSEFSREGRAITPAALAMLVEAFGTDLSELSATCQQIMRDTLPDGDAKPPKIDVEHVHPLTAGRTETTAFAVADAALAGNDRLALQLLRQAHMAGVDPVPLVAALAAKVRGLAKVTAQSATPKQLSMPDWMLRNLRRDARAWSQNGLAQAIEAVARADHDVKGASRDPQYALQRAVLSICRARRNG